MFIMLSDLVLAYRATDYVVFDDSRTFLVRVGHHPLVIDGLLVRMKSRSGVFITAWNPFSKRQSAGGNAYLPLAFRPSKNTSIDYDKIPELRGRRELTGEQMPTLVTVTDPTDVRTVRVVNVDDLGSALGVHLRSISVEMTKDAVTPMDIERHLPFLNKLCEGRVVYRGYGGLFTPNCRYFVMR